MNKFAKHVRCSRLYTVKESDIPKLSRKIIYVLSHGSVKSIAEDERQTLSDTLRTLVEAHRRDRLFDQSDQAYQRLRDDEDTWTDVEDERRDLEGTQADGL